MTNHDDFNGSDPGAAGGLRESNARFSMPPQIDTQGLREAESAKREMVESERYHGASMETLDKLISQEKQFLRSQVHRDKQGVQLLLSHMLAYAGFGYEYQSKKKIAAVHAMTQSVGEVVKILSDACHSYAQNMKDVKGDYVRDRKMLALNKKILDEKTKLVAQRRSEIETLEQEASFSDTSTVREMELECDVIDYENDITLLHTENDSIAIRLMAADDLHQDARHAYVGTSKLLAQVARQEAGLKAASQKADLYAKIQGTAGKQSVHLLYLEAARAVKSMESLLGNTSDQYFRDLPSEGRIMPSSVARPQEQGSSTMRLWETYWRSTVERRGKR